MPSTAFAAELARYGPEQSGTGAISLADAEQYCRRLARSHYENFSVASLFLPRALRRHFYHVYAYCRWADDLADETGDPTRSLELLDWWEAQLDDCLRGEARHPVFVALAETVREFEIPAEPFRDLLVAFRQDQRQTRYEDRAALVEYCRYSANPVGRLVLYLGRRHSDQTMELSDKICTGLQLANFWQDVARDWDQGRIYLPQAACRAHNYDEACFARREASTAFRRMLAAEVDYAEEMLHAGLPLVECVPRELRIDIELFARGGLAILAAIRRLDYDVWTQRPVVTRGQKLKLLLRAWRASRGGPQ